MPAAARPGRGREDGRRPDDRVRCPPTDVRRPRLAAAVRQRAHPRQEGERSRTVTVVALKMYYALE